MRLFFGGAEVPSWRKFLSENNVADVSMSYMGLRRKVKFVRPWTIADKFPADQNILLDSGCFTVNQEDSGYDLDELADIASSYMMFVSQNIDRLHAVTEFDALALGYDWIKGAREDYWDDLGDKFMPVWHAEYGVDELERLAARYKRVGILQAELGDRDLAPVLNSLAGRYGTLLHGMAMTKPDVMREVRWDSVGSTSWINPVKYGETFVWTGHEFKWYPARMKDEARKRHRTLFTHAGFDAEKIAADDKDEVLRLSLWSWGELMTDLNRRRSFTILKGSQDDAEVPEPQQAEGDRAPVPLGMPEKREHMMMPGVDLVRKDESAEHVLHVRGESLRRCDTCFLADRGCPAFKPGAECAYELPIQIRTPQQLAGLEDGLIEMQATRVMFMKMVEDIEGGYIDPALSGEFDRLMRMIKNKREGTMQRASLTIHAQSNEPGKMTMLGNLFGKDEVEKMAELPSPIMADDLIVEADVVKDDPS